jgi:hypothetical protein
MYAFLGEELGAKGRHIKLHLKDIVCFGLYWTNLTEDGTGTGFLNIVIDFWDLLNTENFKICFFSDVIFSAPCTLVVQGGRKYHTAVCSNTDLASSDVNGCAIRDRFRSESFAILVKFQQQENDLNHIECPTQGWGKIL